MTSVWYCQHPGFVLSFHFGQERSTKSHQIARTKLVELRVISWIALPRKVNRSKVNRSKSKTVVPRIWGTCLRKQKAKAEAFAFLPMYDPLMRVSVANRE